MDSYLTQHAIESYSEKKKPLIYHHPCFNKTNKISFSYTFYIEDYLWNHGVGIKFAALHVDISSVHWKLILTFPSSNVGGRVLCPLWSYIWSCDLLLPMKHEERENLSGNIQELGVLLYALFPSCWQSLRHTLTWRCHYTEAVRNVIANIWRTAALGSVQDWW